MKLSILIPTHNRPALFERCVQSVLPMLNGEVEVLVNNDSCDIDVIEHPNITYTFNHYEHLSMVYESLLNRSVGEFVYFLEDDDYLVCDILDQIDPSCDMIVGNYYPMYDTPNKLVYPLIYKDGVLTPSEFIQSLNEEHLQLSQHIYRRSVVADFAFPDDSDIHNDILLTKHAAANSKVIKTTGKIFYRQTIDGGDNISFAETNYGHAI